jgi:ribonucleoside-diphosphate reductase alpha chain
MFDTSYQMEPIFTLYDPKTGFNQHMMAHLHKMYSPGVVERALATIMKDGSIQKASGISRATKRLLQTSIEIPYQKHIAILAAAQRFTDESVSKTVNLPSNAAAGTIKEIFWLAYKKGLNGITIYRDGSRDDQPVNLR